MGGVGIAGEATAACGEAAFAGLGTGLEKAVEASPPGLEKRADAVPLAAVGEVAEGVANMAAAAGAGDAVGGRAKGEVCESGVC